MTGVNIINLLTLNLESEKENAKGAMLKKSNIIRGSMFHGGETALQADCGEFDSHLLHQWR